MTWFAFPGGWGDYNLNGLAEKELALLGAHGYATKAEADAHVNASPTAAQAVFLQGLKAQSVVAGIIPGGNAAAKATGNQQTPTSSGGLNLSWAGASHFALRLAEAVVGIAFLIIGLNALLHNPAGKVAKAMPKVVPV